MILIDVEAMPSAIPIMIARVPAVGKDAHDQDLQVLHPQPGQQILLRIRRQPRGEPVAGERLAQKNDEGRPQQQQGLDVLGPECSKCRGRDVERQAGRNIVAVHGLNTYSYIQPNHEPGELYCPDQGYFTLCALTNRSPTV